MSKTVKKGSKKPAAKAVPATKVNPPKAEVKAAPAEKKKAK
jgi:hypothetical protein